MTSSYFDNIQDVLTKRIALSQHSICIAVAWFTNDIIFESLKSALNKKVKVKVVILNDLINRNEFGLDFGILTKLGAEVRFAKSDNGTMHNKFCIIDKVVITGSYNWTYHANKNDENILMTDEESVVNNYRMEFDRLFGSASPIAQPYEHLNWTEIKEGDFTEYRREIYREVIDKDDIHKEVKKNKLVSIDKAFKSGSSEELNKANSLPTEVHLRTITDVLTSHSQEFSLKLWEENLRSEPYNDVDGHRKLCKWYFVPYCFEEDKEHREYLVGKLKTEFCRNDIFVSGYSLKIYDKDFLLAIKRIMGKNSLLSTAYKHIPEYMLRIEHAMMYYYPFSSPMYNSSQPKTWPNNSPRTISAINVFGIVKEIKDDDEVFYKGWDPKKRGEMIMNRFFVKQL